MKSFANIRIIDFTQAGAGPYCTLLAKFLGAEVIKVESRYKLDEARYVQPSDQVFDSNNSYLFNELNLGKRSITLNLRTLKGVQLFKRLIGISDVLVENMRPGVMKEFGLDYESIVTIKPDIIMLSYSLSGQIGPECGNRGYASISGSLSGLSNLTGYPDDIPGYIGSDFDLTTAANALTPVIAALYYRQKTGRGQYIDFSSREAGVNYTGETLLDFAMNKREQIRCANHDDINAPNNCYRCKCEDSWISISIKTDDEWGKFCETVKHPEWYHDPRFCDIQSRRVNYKELDALIEKWTIHYRDNEVMTLLQEAGIAAVPSLTSSQIEANSHIKDRGILQEVKHSVLGLANVIGVPWIINGSREHVECAPLLGEDNYYVFHKLLDLSEIEINQLENEKVIF